MKYPETLTDIEKELAIHAKDGRSDALFRLAIALDQFGSLTRHITHDQQLNPVSRPHGTKGGEIADAGHAMAQLMTYCILRGIPLQNAMNAAMENLREKDFIKRVNHTEELKGIVASPGTVKGYAFVDEFCENLNKIPIGCILITSHPTSGISQHLSKCIGVITDHGGMNCHTAIVVRELCLKTGTELPCVVGTGNSTKLIKQGQLVKIEENGRITVGD